MKFIYLPFYILSLTALFPGCKKALDVNLTEGASHTTSGDFADPIMPGIFYNFKF